MKWLWRYNETLWKELIQHKQGQAKQWCTNIVTDTFGVGVWRIIRAFWSALTFEGEIWSPQGWNLAFRRLLNDWEIARVADLLTIISGFLGFNMETPPGWTVLSSQHAVNAKEYKLTNFKNRKILKVLSNIAFDPDSESFWLKMWHQTLGGRTSVQQKESYKSVPDHAKRSRNHGI
ncbi:hypothetical protein H5410_052729 [Solanum commersonii]|uniref:Uncharacterized protein n=1 Tax=Solanum commersonii TaxID=4109 RepID=A0A9J5X4F2_SOLCO|nr:hypothetical protein H5410_052729 [Solanum commersonii]